jgi:cysteinyl-tRNA synthetase
LGGFTPLHDHEVGLYTCGPTVYNSAHIGNLRTYIFEDILRRTLELDGFKVKHVMNVTDVGHLTGDVDEGEDKIAKAARETKRDAYEIAQQYEQEFFADLLKLNILPPSITLRATETIELQIELIQTLEKNSVTYTTSDGVYFDTSKLPSYGRLSGQKSTDKQAGARVEVNIEKKNPSDFALWKFSKLEDKRQMEWTSPWGVGFPGWHIECSAMSISEFPDGLDIHCGGIDHIAVHHENEIAQNEASGHHDFVKYWLHGEFLVLPGKRMGKSEGNAVTLTELNVDPLFFRYLTLLTHYRKQLSYTEESLTAAGNALMRLWTMLEDKTLDRSIKPIAKYVEAFTVAMNNDLNTPEALGILHEMMADNEYTEAEKITTLSVFDVVLALDLTPEAAKKHTMVTGHEALLQQYILARKEKRFVDSDQIRKEFEEMGILVEDTAQGSRLRRNKLSARADWPRLLAESRLLLLFIRDGKNPLESLQCY